MELDADRQRLHDDGVQLLFVLGDRNVDVPANPGLRRYSARSLLGRGCYGTHAQQQAGLGIFQRGCNICHSGPETTAAAIGEIVQADGSQKPVQIMLRGANFDRPTFYDRGYYNTGVQKTGNDRASGRSDEKGPFSLTLRAKAGQNIDQRVFDAPIQALPVAINGTFKTPMLRNVELTGLTCTTVVCCSSKT